MVGFGSVNLISYINIHCKGRYWFRSTMCSQTWSQYILVWSLLVAFTIVYAKLTTSFPCQHSHMAPIY